MCRDLGRLAVDLVDEEVDVPLDLAVLGVLRLDGLQVVNDGGVLP